jgi:hypothetical protein
MKPLAKLTFGALVVAAVALGAVAPASAQASFGFSFGYGGPTPRAYYDPCFRPYYARPAYCGYPLYRGRVFIGGAWYDGPFHYRSYRGHREYWHRGRWYRGDLYGPPRHRGYRRGWR